jgi:hypothetical protein
MNIDIENNVTGARETMKGSGSRANVSARSDERIYYNSRDEEQTYSFPFIFNTAASTEYAAYLKNTSATKTLVIRLVDLDGEVATRFQLHEVTGTASGTAVTPKNCNLDSGNDASCTALEGLSAGTGITGLTVSGVPLGNKWVVATGSAIIDTHDAVRLGQNDAIAVYVLETAGGDVSGTIICYFE